MPAMDYRRKMGNTGQLRITSMEQAADLIAAAELAVKWVFRSTVTTLSGLS